MTTLSISSPDLVLRSLDDTWNQARWETLPDDGNRYEVIDGVLYMTSAPSYFHQWITRQIALALIDQLDRTGFGLTTWAPIGLFMPGCDPVQPDLVTIQTSDLGIVHDKRIYGVPTLLVEILSPTNPETDLTIKRAAYARAGVPEYWIVRPASRDMLVCSQPDPLHGDYRREDHIATDSTLNSPTLPFTAQIASFFAGAPDTTL